MDVNYLLRRQQISLHHAEHSPSRSARFAHRRFAKAYGLLLVGLGFPIHPAAVVRASTESAFHPDVPAETIPAHWNEGEACSFNEMSAVAPERQQSDGRTCQHDAWPDRTSSEEGSRSGLAMTEDQPETTFARSMIESFGVRAGAVAAAQASAATGQARDGWERIAAAIQASPSRSAELIERRHCRDG